MLDPFTLALVGGAVGGLLDEKNPLRGATLGAAGGYFAPGLLSAAPAAGATSGAAYTGTAAELAADGLGGVAMTPTAFESAVAGVPGMLKQAKPFMEAAGTGMQVANAFQDKPQPITPSPIATPMPNNNLGNMVANMQQEQVRAIKLERQRREQRRYGGLI